MAAVPQLKVAREDRIAVAREKFFNRGVLPEDDVSPLILRSWERCRESGLDHRGGGSVEVASRGQLEESRNQSTKLLDLASGVMEHVFEQIRASGSMVILADPDGMIIHSLGDASFVDRAQRVALQPGACWTETRLGTNGIGTALQERTPVEIFGSEHYLDRNVFLACCASPILDAHGRMAGVFDISGDYRNPQRHTLGLVRLSVQLLEKRLFESEFAKDILIAFHPRPEYIGSLQEGLIALSPDGTILGANPAAREWLSTQSGDAGAPNFSDLFRLSFGAILDRAQASSSALIRLGMKQGGELYVQVRSMRPLVLTNAGLVEVGEARARVQPGVSAKGGDRSGELRLTLESLATGDERLQRAIDRARRVGGKDIPLLIQGESGVGKELFARAFHNSSARADGPFVPLNCAAIPEHLIESELFGYVGGAFTGARREGAIGKVQQAHGGTLFLDEIGDMPLAMQTRLLRVLQERSVTPVGGMKAIPVDISLVCATHRVLRDAVANGEFREDLYYRVNGLTVTLPPLRERSDVSTLVDRLLQAEAQDSGRSAITISAEVRRFFETYPWPGNIRQLHSVIRVAAALLDDDEDEIDSAHLPEELFGVDSASERLEPCASSTPGTVAPAAPAPADPAATRSLDELELEAIAAVMHEVKGNVSAAARRLGVSRNTLYRKLGRMS
ncbi:MAG TPA: sigma-54-dependent Fis family transcriptional regulator [Thauera sp.]|uniref:sigma-54-dependent Fis family transcriptional regulator n=1 Tax=Thauera sp. TaxID=1905334 RepID=UPI002BDB8D89|nr:sigma-54-dependent Fis family transcriptional regulator [Thauera sp.]HRP25515.1 sigma-54-dependent Fis family transcriptional regulator [Thauera sp.]HRP66337.1 sigma-54-dependent Fis family transcriptional regulator [Thauera sp.]